MHRLSYTSLGTEDAHAHMHQEALVGTTLIATPHLTLMLGQSNKGSYVASAYTLPCHPSTECNSLQSTLAAIYFGHYRMSLSTESTHSHERKSTQGSTCRTPR